MLVPTLAVEFSDDDGARARETTCREKWYPHVGVVTRRSRRVVARARAKPEGEGGVAFVRPKRRGSTGPVVSVAYFESV